MCGAAIIGYYGAPAGETEIRNAAGEPELDAVFDPLIIVVDDCMQSAPAGPVRMFWVPEDGDPGDYPVGPTIVNAFPSDRVCMELWVQGVCTQFYDTAVDATVQDRSFTGVSGTVRADCTTATMDYSHPAYAGFSTTVSDKSDCGDRGTMDRIFFFGFTDPGTGGPTIAGAPAGNYFAEVCYDVSADAHGQFTIDYFGTPDVGTSVYGNAYGRFCGSGYQMDAVFDPLVINVAACHNDGDCPVSDADVCTADRCIGGVCVNQPNVYGDVNRDGAANLTDLFCVLDGFAGDFATCTFVADDIHGTGTGSQPPCVSPAAPPCCPNGVITLADLFAVLDAFAGGDPCCGG